MRSFPLMFVVLCLANSLAAQPYYSGAYGSYPHCQACHATGTASTNQFPWWDLTGHASTYDSHPEIPWQDDCLPCHTTGWDTSLANGGFDDFFFLGDTLGMQQMRNVQCEACHGPTDQFPHPLTTVINRHAEACGGCHNGLGRPTYDEWSQGGHSRMASSGTQQQACAKCHESASAAVYLETGHLLTELPEEPIWQITCSTCHPTHSPLTYGAQLYQEADTLCRGCHSMDGAIVGEDLHAPQKEMLLGVGSGAFEWPGYVYENSCHNCLIPSPCVMCHMYSSAYGNPDSTTTAHSAQPDIGICIWCHPYWIPPDSSFDFLGAQAEIDSLLGVLADLLQEADTNLTEWDQAKFDYDFVFKDGSRGIHNFFYASGLLVSSIEGLRAASVLYPLDNTLPDIFSLSPPYPNPFNGTTCLRLTLPAGCQIVLQLYAIRGSRLGEPLWQGWQEAGDYEITVAGNNLPSGIYLLHLQAGSFAETAKLILLK